MKRTLLFVIFLSCAIFGTAAFAEEQLITARTAVFPSLSYDAEPAGTSPGVYITNVATGYSISGYPCYACVAAGAIGESQAQFLLPPSSAFTTSIQIQDTSFKGTLTVDFALTQNSKVVLSSSTVFEGLVGNEAGVIEFTGTLPASTGATVVVVKILNGTTVLGKSSSNIYIK